jgi:uncharacterized membrane protein YhaH (DUF805 family)
MQRYFSFRGRLSRLEYWRWTLRLALLFAPAWILGLFAVIAFGRFGGLLLGLALAAYLVVAASVTVRRLHDRGRSAWWLIPFYLAPLLAHGAAIDLMNARRADLVLAGLGLALAALAVNLWALVDVGFRRGAAGENGFGAVV